MGGRIDVYLDIASLYSYVALALLRRDEQLYTLHNVELVIHPVLLGAINNASGNRPPWTLPAKAKAGEFDSRRSCRRAGVSNIQTPPDFMERAKTVLPLRALHHIQQHYPTAFLTTFHYFFYRFWAPPNANLTDPEVLRQVIADVPAGFNGTLDDAAPRLFSKEDADRIVPSCPGTTCQGRFDKGTNDAIQQGAYGAPWLWVRNDAGVEEPFFGSDRFHFVYELLGLPYQDVALLLRNCEP